MLIQILPAISSETLVQRHAEEFYAGNDSNVFN
jgi:hypothetical protein